ncbi:efflux RND transporter periplasmic adaptor subunit [Roseiconus lacunae]|uniref:HlyD family efflux transporter periplasmic adaptor subunit n=1 Tax=Roseiconus lacunae TaxID=2605694 RepID=A0ABT7PGJ2_9BACT|nr:HlyD family efflux transporter periplasmic adaptor subunit [Roseiconus lacunae]MDM4015591.1 HlyD family efflux transporter periplasmic adaptor subunit [Roseiconus lacunae]
MILRSCYCFASLGLLLTLCSSSGLGQDVPAVDLVESAAPNSMTETTESSHEGPELAASGSSEQASQADQINEEESDRMDGPVPDADSVAGQEPIAAERTNSLPAQPPSNSGLSQARTLLIHNTKIAATISGLVKSVDVSAGQTILADTIVARLDDRLAEQEMIAVKAAYQAKLLESQTDTIIRDAAQEFETRQTDLRQAQLANQTYTGAVSEMQLRQLRLRVERSELKREQAELQTRVATASADHAKAKLEIAKEIVARHRIRSSRDGIVAEVIAQAGQWVQAGQPVVRVISLDPIRVECEIDPALIHDRIIGQRVRFVPRQVNPKAGSSGRLSVAELRGEISFVSSEVTSVSGRVVVWADMANPDGRVRSGVVGTLYLDDSQSTSKVSE